jgi:serine protease
MPDEFDSSLPRVVVKFHDHVKAPYEDGIERQAGRYGLGPWRELAERYPGLTLMRVYRAHSADDLRQLVEHAAELDPGYRPVTLSSYYFVDLPDDAPLDELADELRRWESVQSAYVDRTGPDPLVNPSDDPRWVSQGYLDPAPDGIDAEYAWAFPGGDGASVRVIDMERGWTLNHEDLAAHNANLLHGVLLDSSRAHGTSVLGEICATDNTIGCVGIAPHATVNVVSYNGSTRPDAIVAAILNLGFGDVLLLEAQVIVGGSDPNKLGPIEVYDAEFDAIRLATALGIVVIEAGGNGTNPGMAPPLDLDSYTNAAGLAILNRDPLNPDFRDSGAIIVTAASSTAPHTRLSYAPYGRRIDCYAWGQNIDTCSSDSLGALALYTSSFNGTSGASPIVTGAALVVQGMAQAALGFRFGPRRMRAILSDPATGTPRAATEPTLIGVMPNLRAIIDGDVLGLSPDVYLRDFVGDSGEPHVGNISASPDLILLPAPVADPQASFGAGSGTENSATLGATAETGHDNVIYVRVRNQGMAPATDVEARVFWSEVATLVTPDMWHEVGAVTIPMVPSGEVLTVSDAITWPAAEIPAPGHYCFVGLVGNGRDPAPEPADFLNWTNFTSYIQNNNNVTWRNFNVEPPGPSADPHALPFLFPGAPDKARRMTLELVGRLPFGSKVTLEVPEEWRKLLGEHANNATFDERRRRWLVPVKASGVTPVLDGVLPASARVPLTLRVRVPDRDHDYPIAARQLFDGLEVGRVTWVLTS